MTHSYKLFLEADALPAPKVAFFAARTRGGCGVVCVGWEGGRFEVYVFFLKREVYGPLHI